MSGRVLGLLVDVVLQDLAPRGWVGGVVMGKKAVVVVMMSMLAGVLLCAESGVAQPELRTKLSLGHVVGRYVPDEIVVMFHKGVSEEKIGRINRGYGAVVLSTSRFAGFKRLRVPKGKTVEEMVAVYRRNPNVAYAEPNFIAHAFEAPDDPYYSYQWHMDNMVYGGIHLNAARDLGLANENIVVAVIDTGVAYENYTEVGVPVGRSGKYSGGAVYAQAPDLSGTSFVPGYDFVNDDAHPNDDEGHGTHVAGTIAQSTDNAYGVAGVAAGCSIMPVKVLDSTGSGTYTAIADGIYFASRNGAKVINMSLGGSVPSVTLEAALVEAHENGVVIVCAAGNDAAGVVSYPAAYDNYCIAVGATRFDETVSWYSNRGASLDLTAPGGDVNVDQNGPDVDGDGVPDGDGYGDGVLQQTFSAADYRDFGFYFYQGTSMAAPHVAGVAALLLAQGLVGAEGEAPSPAEIQAAMQAGAEDHGPVGWDKDYGWGIVDAEGALRYYLEREKDANRAPIADPQGPYEGDEDAQILFYGAFNAETQTGSYDPDGDTITYLWDFGDGATGAGPIHAHTYSRSGSYTVTLVVNDGKVDSEPVSTLATIREVNDVPIADAGPDIEAGVGQLVSFDGSNSFDEDGDSLSYEWDFNDGQTSFDVKPSHAFNIEGTYAVTLKVDDGLAFAVDTAMVVVAGLPQPVTGMHVDSIDMVLRSTGVNTAAQAVVKIVSGDGVPVAGATVSGSWSGATTDADTGVTDASGLVTLVSDNVKRVASGTTYSFTVEDVVSADWAYDADANGETTDSITTQ